MATHLEYDTIQINGKVLRGEEIREYCAQQNEIIFKDIQTFLDDWLNPNPFIIIQTSGSTGPPQKMRVEKIQMIASAKMTESYFYFQKNDTALLCLPVNFIAGKMMLVRAMVSRLNLMVVPSSSNPLEYLSADQKIDFAAMVPLQFQTICHSTRMNQFSKILLGGGALSKELELIASQSVVFIFQSYGMTETLSHIAIRALNGKLKSPYYQSLPGIEIGVDERGCLTILAPQLHNGLLVTNDLVTLINEKEFLWNGRLDNVVNSGGIKLFPERIEEKLFPVFSRNFFFCGIPDEHLGEKLVMVIEGKRHEEDEVTLENLFKNRLEKFEIPRSIFYVDEFIYTESGKLNRPKTQEQISK